jgi:nicotinic acid mononucleotide adenylyltransferase
MQENSFENKLVKYETKLRNLEGGSTPTKDTTIHIYCGGSYSPPTIAHETICLDTITFLQEYCFDKPFDKIVFHIVPASHFYGKPSIGLECISFEDRFAMLSIMSEKIRAKINPVFKDKKYEIEIGVSDFEHVVSLREKKYLGTYNYLSEFAKTYDINPNNVFLLYGLDNAKLLLTTGPKRWKNPIHLVSNFKFLIYPRSGDQINYAKFIELFSENIKTFNPADPTTQEINNITKGNNLDDIQKEVGEFNSNPEGYMRDRFITVTSSNADEKNDSVSIAEASSSNIRLVLYEYPDFKIKDEIIHQNLQMLDSRILAYIQDHRLYKNGDACEGSPKYIEIIKKVVEDNWITSK